MNTTTFAVVEPQEAVSLLESPLSPAETAEYEADKLAIELAGKDRLEKALIIGQRLSNIYNHATFREEARSVRTSADRGLWEAWANHVLPRILPEAEGRSIQWVDGRRLLWEQRKLISSLTGQRGALPDGVKVANYLAALVPRKFPGPAGWNPAILDDPDAAEGIAAVWDLACRNAEQNQRRNGPTAEDVRAAREELRPRLEQQGLIRSAPASFQAATAARVEAARQRTVTVAAVDPAKQEREAAAFRDTMASIRDTKAERQAKVEVDHVRQQLDAAEAERQHQLEEEVRLYNSRLHAASKAIHDLLIYLQTLSRVHGTQYLDDMRSVSVLGLITVGDDVQRLQEAGQELIESVKLARSSEPPAGMNVQTIDL